MATRDASLNSGVGSSKATVSRGREGTYFQEEKCVNRLSYAALFILKTELRVPPSRFASFATNTPSLVTMAPAVAMNLRRILPIKRQVAASGNTRLRGDLQLRFDTGRHRCVTARASEVRRPH